MIVKVEHVLILVIAAFVLYHLSRCNCGNGFSIGNFVKCHGVSEVSCSNHTICNWDDDRCRVIDCNSYNDHKEACDEEERCIALPWNDDGKERWVCSTAASYAIESDDEESDDNEGRRME